MGMFDEVLEFAKVIASEITGPNTDVKLNLGGIGSFEEAETDETGEVSPEEEVYQSLGIIGRPLPPDGTDDDDLFCDSLAARASDGLKPFAFRDLRLNRAVNPGGAPGTTPAEGQIMFVGYGGGFLSHSLTATDSGDQKANIEVWYAPYEFSSGTAAKAHTIVMDTTPGNESVSITHGDGVFIQMSADTGGGSAGMTFAVDNDTWGKMEPGLIFWQASAIQLKGNVGVGAQPELGIPLLGGPVSPPCPSLFLSPV